MWGPARVLAVGPAEVLVSSVGVSVCDYPCWSRWVEVRYPGGAFWSGRALPPARAAAAPSLPRRDAFARAELRTWPAELRCRPTSDVEVLVPATRSRTRKTR